MEEFVDIQPSSPTEIYNCNILPMFYNDYYEMPDIISETGLIQLQNVTKPNSDIDTFTSYPSVSGIIQPDIANLFNMDTDAANNQSHSGFIQSMMNMSNMDTDAANNQSDSGSTQPIMNMSNMDIDAANNQSDSGSTEPIMNMSNMDKDAANNQSHSGSTQPIMNMSNMDTDAANNQSHSGFIQSMMNMSNMDTDAANNQSDSGINPSIACIAKKKRQGRTYLCPFTEGHVIKNSRLNEHIKNCHSILLSQRTIESLVLETKRHTEDLIKNVTSKSKCNICGLLFTKKNIGSHLIHKHKVAKATIQKNCRENKVSSAIENINKENGIPIEVNEILDKFELHLSQFGGGNNKKTTSRALRLGVQIIFQKLQFENHFQIIDEQNRVDISNFLTAEAIRTPSGVKRLVEGLSNYGKFLQTNHRNIVFESGFDNDLLSFLAQTVEWGKSFSKIKKENNARLRDKLDNTLLSDEAVNQCYKVIEILKETAEKEDASSYDISIFLAAMFSFGSGNACRPDVCNNATIQEFIDWKQNPNKEFLVANHKTNQIYGAQRVDVTSIKDLLMHYGENRLLQDKSYDEPLFRFKSGFSFEWRNIRIKYKEKFPLLFECTHTSFRKYMETKSKASLTPLQQEMVSQRMSHRPSVARQSYQATLQSQSTAAASFMRSLNEIKEVSPNKAASVTKSINSKRGAALAAIDKLYKN